jgi:hypothetical protein
LSESESWRIDELDRLEAIEEVINRYEKTYHSVPINVSHWNTSAGFKKRMRPLLNFQDVDPIDYLYSYYVPGLADVLRKLGFDGDRHSCLLTSASTSSIVAVVNWLHSLTIDRLVIYGPCYFAVVHACRALNVEVEMRYMVREDGRYRLPSLPRTDRVALWITNPIYATGQYLHQQDVARLAAHARGGGMVVLDEALAMPWLAAGRHLGTENAFACIYSPHKAISVNAFKFSAIVVQKRDEDFFDQWADVLTGSLPASSVAAVNHYLSRSYDEYANVFLDITGKSRRWLLRQQAQFVMPLFDRDPIGNYVTLFFPDLPADIGYETEFLWTIAQNSGAVFIPAIRSYFDPTLGLGLRVNLALDSPLFRGGLLRLLAALRHRR